MNLRRAISPIVESLLVSVVVALSLCGACLLVAAVRVQLYCYGCTHAASQTADVALEPGSRSTLRPGAFCREPRSLDFILDERDVPDDCAGAECDVVIAWTVVQGRERVRQGQDTLSFEPRHPKRSYDQWRSAELRTEWGEPPLECRVEVLQVGSALAGRSIEARATATTDWPWLQAAAILGAAGAFVAVGLALLLLWLARHLRRRRLSRPSVSVIGGAPRLE